MNYYNAVKNFFSGNEPQPSGMEQGTVNTFNSINVPYGGYLLPSNVINRNSPSQGTFGVNSSTRMGQVVQPLSVIGPQNTQTVKDMNGYFLNHQPSPIGTNNTIFTDNVSLVDLNLKRENTYTNSNHTIYTDNNNKVVSDIKNEIAVNYYTNLASETLHQRPDPLMKVFFSDENINHLRNTVVEKVKQITADSGVAGDKNGVTIQTPNMDDFFYYMVNIFQNYKIHNGSICFVGLKNSSNLKSDIAKLNTNVLQEYVSKMVSQINMYIYYYKDASQLPDQLSLPTYTSMRSNNKVLEYNNGFVAGNSIGMARYDQVGNVI